MWCKNRVSLPGESATLTFAPPTRYDVECAHAPIRPDGSHALNYAPARLTRTPYWVFTPSESAPTLSTTQMAMAPRPEPTYVRDAVGAHVAGNPCSCARQHSRHTVVREGTAHYQQQHKTEANYA